MTKAEAQALEQRRAAFENALDALCKLHKVRYAHQDGHGAGEAFFDDPSPGLDITVSVPWDRGGRGMFEHGVGQ